MNRKQSIIDELNRIRAELSVQPLENILVPPLPSVQPGETNREIFFLPYEKHKYYELAIQLSGQSIVLIDNSFYNLNPHQICVINRGTEHLLGWYSNQEEPMTMLWVAVTNDTIRSGISTYIGDKRYKNWGLDILAPGGYLLREIFDERNNNDKFSADAIRAYLSAFLTLLIRKLSFAKQIWDSSRKTAIVSLVQSYISDHLSSPLSLEQLSKIASVSTTYLCKVFKQITGETVFSYIQDCRIRTATHYLLYSDKELTEIAEALGFYDQFHFSKTFKTYMGMSPSYYRATYQEEMRVLSQTSIPAESEKTVAQKQ